MSHIFATSLLLALVCFSLSGNSARAASGIFSSPVKPLTIEDERKKAFEALQGNCDRAIFSDDNYLVASQAKLRNNKGVISVIDLHDTSKSFELIAASRVVDLKIVNGVLYSLTANRFQAWDLNSRKELFTQVSHPSVDQLESWRQYASSFVIHGQQAIITHGVWGLSVLNLKSLEFDKLIKMPTVSSAQDIDLVDQNSALIAVDNDHEATFRGMYVFDLKSLSIVKQIKIDNAFPSAVRILDNNRLMMIYFNAVWKFPLDQALKSSEASPTRRAWKFPNLFVVDMVGKVAFDKKNLYSCFKVMDEKTGVKSLSALAFDLETLKLK